MKRRASSLTKSDGSRKSKTRRGFISQLSEDADDCSSDATDVSRNISEKSCRVELEMMRGLSENTDVTDTVEVEAKKNSKLNKKTIEDRIQKLGIKQYSLEMMSDDDDKITIKLGGVTEAVKCMNAFNNGKFLSSKTHKMKYVREVCPSHKHVFIHIKTTIKETVLHILFSGNKGTVDKILILMEQIIL